MANPFDDDHDRQDDAGVAMIPQSLQGDGLRIAVVRSRFNEGITQLLWEACRDELIDLGVSAEDILYMSVPGALEIPSVLQQLSDSSAFDALIALGAVIKGDTYHFEVVSDQSAAGVMQVAIEGTVPVINGILTTYTEDQAQVRALEKGTEAARAAVEMASLHETLVDILGDDEDDDDWDDQDEHFKN